MLARMCGFSCNKPVIDYVPIRPTIRHITAEAIAFLRPSHAVPINPALPRGDERPVLVLPVIRRGDEHAAPMRAALDQLGHRTFCWGLGTNLGPTPPLLAGIEHRLVSLHAEYGPLTIAGFSLEGIFARLLAHLHPSKIRQVAIVCSLFRETVDSAFLPLRPFLRAWRTPNLPEMAAWAARPLPVPGTFIFSRHDGIVTWQSCVEPSQPEDCFEIPGPHVNIIRDSDVLAILARRFARKLPGQD